jgi:hypothetical protein
MLGMEVQRSRNNYRIEIFQVEQTAMIVEGLRAIAESFTCLTVSTIRIRDGDEFHIWNMAQLLEQISAASSHADYADPNAIIRAQSFCGG